MSSARRLVRRLGPGPRRPRQRERMCHKTIRCNAYSTDLASNPQRAAVNRVHFCKSETGMASKRVRAAGKRTAAEEEEALSAKRRARRKEEEEEQEEEEEEESATGRRKLVHAAAGGGAAASGGAANGGGAAAESALRRNDREFDDAFRQRDTFYYGYTAIAEEDAHNLDAETLAMMMPTGSDEDDEDDDDEEEEEEENEEEGEEDDYEDDEDEEDDYDEDEDEYDDEDDDDDDDYDEEDKVDEMDELTKHRLRCQSRLVSACCAGNIRLAKLALAEGAMVYENVGFVEACSRGHTKMVAFLLKEGAKPTAFSGDRSALTAASANGHVDVVRMLLDAGANSLSVDNGALIAACSEGKLEVAELLLLHGGARVDSLDNEAICVASRNGHAKVVELLLSLGADPSAQDGLALVLAAIAGHLNVVNLLLEAGANVHSRNDRALRIASGEVFRDPSAVMQRLLDAGANVHSNDDESLMAACTTGPIETVKLLLESGANVHARDGEALIVASHYGRVGVVKLLVGAGAIIGDIGKTAVAGTMNAIAKANILGNVVADAKSRRGRIEVVAILIRSGVGVEGLNWNVLHPHEQLYLLFAVRPSQIRELDSRRQVQLLRYVVRPRLHLLDALFRVRARLDQPPSQPLGSSKPSREELIAHLKTAGRRFARDYWAEGLPIFLKGAELGPVPAEFLHVPKHALPRTPL